MHEEWLVQGKVNFIMLMLLGELHTMMKQCRDIVGVLYVIEIDGSNLLLSEAFL